jgi:hypothetical protein
MAGSLAHIVDKNGAFWMSLIENMGDAHEALQECFDIIALLLATGISTDEFAKICDQAKAPVPKHIPVFGRYRDDDDC